MAQHNPLSVHADPLASKKEAWSGRFSEPMAEFVLRYTASVNFDKRMAEADIAGSVAHAKMLAKCGIISKDDLNDIERGMRQILQEIKENRFEWKLELEDVHLNIEARLTELVGDAGKRLHTGRSRNDQVALDIRLYLRNEIDQIMDLLSHLQESLLTVAEKNIDTIMPGYTHMQVAQPVTLGHHCLAYAEMFERDRERLADCRKRVNRSPLGAAALAGTTYPIDREYTAELLGFEGVTQNSLDSVSDRDFAIEFCSCASLIMIHISRMSEELIYWMNTNFAYIMLPDRFTTGSSIMPQKKNPDIAELIRGKAGRVYGALMSMLTVMKGIPLAYDKDLQEDKELTFDAIDTVKGCLLLFTGMVSTMTFRKDVMETSAKNGFTNATDAADYLVNHGVPFRDAHGIIGQLVLLCINENKALDDLTLEQFKSISPVFEEDIYDAISMKTCVEKRVTIGAPGAEAMKKVIEVYKKELNA